MEGSWQLVSAGQYCSNVIFTPDGLHAGSDEVLLYKSEEDEWSTVGQLSTPRYFHGMSLVPGRTMDFCF